MTRLDQTYRIELCNLLHIFSIISACKGCQSIRVELATLRIQLLTVFIGQFCAKAVEGDDERTTVGFKLGDGGTIQGKSKLEFAKDVVSNAESTNFLKVCK